MASSERQTMFLTPLTIVKYTTSKFIVYYIHHKARCMSPPLLFSVRPNNNHKRGHDGNSFEFLLAKKELILFIKLGYKLCPLLPSFHHYIITYNPHIIRRFRICTNSFGFNLAQIKLGAVGYVDRDSFGPG